jgi:hypothetical protein
VIFAGLGDKDRTLEALGRMAVVGPVSDGLDTQSPGTGSASRRSAIELQAYRPGASRRRPGGKSTLAKPHPLALSPACWPPAAAVESWAGCAASRTERSGRMRRARINMTLLSCSGADWIASAKRFVSLLPVRYLSRSLAYWRLPPYAMHKSPGTPILSPRATTC